MDNPTHFTQESVLPEYVMKELMLISAEDRELMAGFITEELATADMAEEAGCLEAVDVMAIAAEYFISKLRGIEVDAPGTVYQEEIIGMLNQPYGPAVLTLDIDKEWGHVDLTTDAFVASLVVRAESIAQVLVLDGIGLGMETA